MKKLMALLLSMMMVLSVFSFAGAENVSADSIADDPEFQVMNLGNYKYGEDYISLYE